MSVKMVDNMIETGVDLLLTRNKKLPAQIRERAEALSWEICEDNSIGNGIDKYGMPFIIELLTSSDEYVNKRAPEYKDLTLEQRQIFAGKIETHSKTCNRCVLKIRQDSLLQDEIDVAFEQDRNGAQGPNTEKKEVSEEGHETPVAVKTTTN
jgi:hypothetical protein